MFPSGGVVIFSTTVFRHVSAGRVVLFSTTGISQAADQYTVWYYIPFGIKYRLVFLAVWAWLNAAKLTPKKSIYCHCKTTIFCGPGARAFYGPGKIFLPFRRFMFGYININTIFDIRNPKYIQDENNTKH